VRRFLLRCFEVRFFGTAITDSLVLEGPECLPPGIVLFHSARARIAIPIHAARRTKTSAIRITNDVFIEREHQLLTHRVAHIKLSTGSEHMRTSVVFYPWCVRGEKDQRDSVFEPTRHGLEAAPTHLQQRPLEDTSHHDLSGACMRSLEPYFDRASPLDAALIPQWRISRKSSLDQDGSFPSQATEIKT